METTIEHRLSLVEARLDRLEGRPTPPPCPTPPPRPQPVAPPTAPPPPPHRSDAETEFFLGAQLLPRLGAGLMLMGLAYFVYWAYSNGMISPQMAFLGELGVSVTFLTLGFALRKATEQFGDILKAIGCSGLFMSCAAGHLFHHVYDAKAMVGSCLLISLATMAYSVMSRGKSFYAIGLFGGIVTSILPLTANDAATSQILHVIVFASAMLVAARNRWLNAAAFCWLGFFLLHVPYLLDSSGIWQLKMLAFEGLSLLGLASCLFADREETSGLYTYPIVAATSAAAFLPHGGAQASAAVSLYALGIFGLAATFRTRLALRNNLILAGIGVFLIAVPMGLIAWRGPLLQVVLAYALLGYALKFRQTIPAWMGWSALVAATVSLLVRDGEVTTTQQIALALATLPAIVLHSASCVQTHFSNQRIHVVNVAFGGLIVTRIAALLSGSADALGMPFTIAWSVYALVILAIGLLAQLRDLRMIGIFGLLAIVSKVLFVDLAMVETINKVAILTALGAAMLAGGYLTIRFTKREVP